MYKMERLNVIRYVATEKERDKLKAEGFKEVTVPEWSGKKGDGKKGDDKNGAGETDGGDAEAENAAGDNGREQG